MRALSRRLLLMGFLPLVACGKDATKPSTPAMSDSARTYLNAALDIMQAHSVMKYKVAWPALRQRAFDNASGARTYPATYGAIRTALVELGDRHSGFYPPGTYASVTPVGGAQALGIDGPLTARRIDGLVGYILIPGFSGSGGAVAFADSIQKLIAQTDTSSLCGWVVDLRDNLGGNMWPMLAGVGPILGEGDAGMFVDADGRRTVWYYAAGVAGERPSLELVKVTPPRPYMLIHSMPRVAVLTNARTASSGEAIVVAFRARPDTRSFGEATWGVSTANAGYRLVDGAVVNLTVAIDADRTGTVYGDRIVPDSVTGAVGDALAAGVAWIESKPGCH